MQKDGEIKLRVPKADIQAFKAAALASRQTLSEWLRWLAYRAIRKQK